MLQDLKSCNFMRLFSFSKVPFCFPSFFFPVLTCMPSIYTTARVWRVTSPDIQPAQNVWCICYWAKFELLPPFMWPTAWWWCSPTHTTWKTQDQAELCCEWWGPIHLVKSCVASIWAGEIGMFTDSSQSCVIWYSCQHNLTPRNHKKQCGYCCHCRLQSSSLASIWPLVNASQCTSPPNQASLHTGTDTVPCHSSSNSSSSLPSFTLTIPSPISPTVTFEWNVLLDLSWEAATKMLGSLMA